LTALALDSGTRRGFEIAQFVEARSRNCTLVIARHPERTLSIETERFDGEQFGLSRRE
jgi:hypothetical protein